MVLNRAHSKESTALRNFTWKYIWFDMELKVEFSGKQWFRQLLWLCRKRTFSCTKCSRCTRHHPHSKTFTWKYNIWFDMELKVEFLGKQCSGSSLSFMWKGLFHALSATDVQEFKRLADYIHTEDWYLLVLFWCDGRSSWLHWKGRSRRSKRKEFIWRESYGPWKAVNRLARRTLTGLQVGNAFFVSLLSCWGGGAWGLASWS